MSALNVASPDWVAKIALNHRQRSFSTQSVMSRRSPACHARLECSDEATVTGRRIACWDALCSRHPLTARANTRPLTPPCTHGDSLIFSNSITWHGWDACPFPQTPRPRLFRPADLPPCRPSAVTAQAGSAQPPGRSPGVAAAGSNTIGPDQTAAAGALDRADAGVRRYPAHRLVRRRLAPGRGHGRARRPALAPLGTLGVSPSRRAGARRGFITPTSLALRLYPCIAGHAAVAFYLRSIHTCTV